MRYFNIELGKNVEIDPSASINNVKIGDNVKIAKRCSIYGSETYQMLIKNDCQFGMNCIINGFAAQITIGECVSIAQNVHIMVDSGPGASSKLQILFPIEKGPVTIGDHCWIGASVIIMPNVELGQFTVVRAGSYVNRSFPPYSIIGGNPATLLKSFKDLSNLID